MTKNLKKVEWKGAVEGEDEGDQKFSKYTLKQQSSGLWDNSKEAEFL